MILSMVTFLFFTEFLNYISLFNLQNAVNGLLVSEGSSIVNMGETMNFIAWTLQVLMIIVFPLVMYFFLSKFNPNKFFVLTLCLSIVFHFIIFLFKEAFLMRILVDIFKLLNSTICVAITILILKNVPPRGISSVYVVVYISQIIGSLIFGLPSVWNIYKSYAQNYFNAFLGFGVFLDFLLLFVVFLYRNTQLLSQNTHNKFGGSSHEPFLAMTEETFHTDASKLSSIKQLLLNRFFWLYGCYTVLIMNIFSFLSNIFFSKTLTRVCQNQVTDGARYFYTMILFTVIIFAFLFGFLADKYGRRFHIVLMATTLQILSLGLSFLLDKSENYYSFIPAAINYAAGFSCLYPGLALFVNRNMIITAMVIINMLENFLSSINTFVEILSLANADDDLQFEAFRAVTVFVLIYSFVLFILYRKKSLAVDRSV
jgi:MFS family permease